MKLTTIKQVVMTAILLPFLFMIVGGLIVVRMSYREYASLDADKRFSNLLSQAGTMTSTTISNEGKATVAYLGDPSPAREKAMRDARSALDEARARLYRMLSEETISDDNFARLLSDWSATYGPMNAYRSLVDAGTASPAGIVAAYQPSSLKQLEVVDFLATLITDKTLLHKSMEFFSTLSAHEGNLVMNFLVRRSLLENGLSVADRQVLAEAQARHRAGVSQLRYHRNTAVINDILAFEESETGKQIERLTQAVVANVIPPSLEALAEWDALQSRRYSFWHEQIVASIADIRATGDQLAERAERHLMMMLAIVGGLLLAVATVVFLATRGIHLVSRLSRERELLVKELRSASQTDLLTGLYNRRGFETASSALLEQAFRASRWVSIVLFDLDHFKQVNDRHGHDAGDAVLKQVAFIARKNFRSFDLLVRHGGEEFLALLPDSTPEEAALVAERVRQAIEDAEIDIGDGTILKVTASFGCAGREERSGDGVLERLIKRADLALYGAKHSGRNRVVADAFVPEPQSGQQKKKSI